LPGYQAAGKRYETYREKSNCLELYRNRCCKREGDEVGAEMSSVCRRQLKCDGTRAETRFRLSAKRTSPFKSAGASVQSTTGSRGVRISGGNDGYVMFRGSVKSTGCPLHSPVSPSLPLPCVTACHHISTGVYKLKGWDIACDVCDLTNRTYASIIP
jgi:hypothetical protein